MDKIIRIGMDTLKHVFQLHGVNADPGRQAARALRQVKWFKLVSVCEGLCRSNFMTDMQNHRREALALLSAIEAGMNWRRQ